uniref:Uncharacterized protein n=1 Tax=Pararge aegeria TaxID=116150 RepID=S4P6V1_9NEOP
MKEHGPDGTVNQWKQLSQFCGKVSKCKKFKLFISVVGIKQVLHNFSFICRRGRTLKKLQQHGDAAPQATYT